MERKVYEFMSKQTGDPIVEWKVCKLSGVTFAIFQSDLDFYDKISPIYNGIKYSIPTPTLCPEERLKRRLVFRNEKKLYRSKCSATGNNIISIYSPNKDFKVYDQAYWRSDKRDPLSYGVDFDFSKTFAENFSQLDNNVPKLSLMVMKNENSNFTNYVRLAKSIYMSNDIMESQNILYSNTVRGSKDCIDIMDCKGCNNCYQIIRGEECTECFFSQNIKNCYQCSFCINCKDCKNCFFCTDIFHKEGYFLNEKVDLSQIEKIKKDLRTGNIEKYIEMFETLKAKRIRKSLDLVNCENCFGDILSNSQNCRLYFDSYNNENCHYGLVGDSNNNCLDVCICNPNCEFGYELVSAGEEQQCMCNIACGNSHDVYYSFLCMYSSNLFGCIGLQNKQYCIFNKQYTKEEYEALVPKIIQHMQKTGERGEFFHQTLSPFSYDETIANDYFPMTENEAKTLGYNRWNCEVPFPKVEKVIKATDLPKDIQKIDKEILEYAIECKITGRPFKIVAPELEFYRKHYLPIPDKHPDIRYQERWAKKPGKTLFLRHCDKCGIEMLSVYTEKYTGNVYCEACYNKEIYG